MDHKTIVRLLNPADRYQRRYGDRAPILAQDAARGNALGTVQGRRPPRQIKRGSRPNAGVEAMYRQKLQSMIDEMHASVDYWLASAYRNNPPEMTQDGHPDALVPMGDGRTNGSSALSLRFESMVGRTEMAFDRRTPADILKDAFDVLAKRWLKRFDDAASHLAGWFATSAASRSDATLHQILRRSGFAVRFQMTPAMRDIVDATVHENVSLIKSIPQQYLTQVEGAVMRSVTAGRDLASLTKELREQHGVTKRRAKLIAHSQNNMATAAFTRVRQVEHGLQAIWVHSHAGKTPRPTHLANNGKPYDPAVGWYDPAERKRIFPGELINCRCFSRTIVPGFE